MLKKILLYLLVGFSFFGFIESDVFALDSTTSSVTTESAAAKIAEGKTNNGYIQAAETKALNDVTTAQSNYDSLVKEKQKMDYDNPLNTKTAADYDDEIAAAKTKLDAAEAAYYTQETSEGRAAAIAEGKAEAARQEAYKNSPDNIGSAAFKLDVNKLSPSKNKWTEGPATNISNLLKNIVYLLLIIIPSLAVLFIVIGGIKIILAGGDSSKVGQGKTIITFNIIAVVVSLLSYSIIQLTTWILGGI
ncbi:MAG: pilin [Candidatus Gracilibacteria bacterium]|nr:pilin [Candidatus Gracilibacteria bacterium]